MFCSWSLVKKETPAAVEFRHHINYTVCSVLVWTKTPVIITGVLLVWHRVYSCTYVQRHCMWQFLWPGLRRNLRSVYQQAFVQPAHCKYLESKYSVVTHEVHSKSAFLVRKKYYSIGNGFTKIHPWEQPEFSRAVWWAGRMQDYLSFKFAFFLIFHIIFAYRV